ncbi:MAG: hypothetical protein ACI4XE_04165 [Acutalibacteraceae bacterium]
MSHNVRLANSTDDKIVIKYADREFILNPNEFADIDKQNGIDTLTIESRPESEPTSCFKLLKQVKNSRRKFFGKYETSVVFCCRLTAEFDLRKLKSDTLDVRQTWLHCFHRLIIYSRFLLSPSCKAVHTLPDVKAKRNIRLYLMISALVIVLLSAVFTFLGVLLCDKLEDKTYAVLFLLVPLLAVSYVYIARKWLKFFRIEKHQEILKIPDSDYVEFEKYTPKAIYLKEEADGEDDDPDFD